MALNPKQEKLITELLQQPTVAEAAAAAGYSERNIYYLLAEPEFAAEYRRARQEALAHATARLQAAAAKAVACLQGLVEDASQPAAARVAAAGKLLDLAYRSGEADLAERLAEIERQLRELLTPTVRVA